ncbi:thiolase family protein [Kribbella sp. NBC_00709]|uniref:thiolase family protein n=1 Tax=Kribbella sp. NBC_00709 TaxID=2975972 RepID=UPI002E27AB9A|nr:thiolase family protein [Kribbella sp. NBC_00709]
MIASSSSRVWIAGVGMTTFGVHHELTNHDLARWAVRSALSDAGAELTSIDAAFFGTASHGFLERQVMVSGQIALRTMGFHSIPVYNVENACATGATALNLAVTQVRSGAADIALAVGAEKMHVGDPRRTMELFDTAYDVSDPAALLRTLKELGGEVDDEDVGRRSIFMDIYAALARNHMRLYGTTQAQLAAVAAKNHAHAADNARAHYRKSMTIADVLRARKLAHPLTVPMCAPVTDGAAAVVVCNDDGLRRLGAERPVQVLATVLGTGSDHDLTSFDAHITLRVAANAYERAGIGPDDVDVAEVHDATAFGELLQTELLGLVPRGEGGLAAWRGETTLGGRIPVNPSGGLESKGHPLAATGLGQVFELTEQLRGTAGSRQVPGARIALAENGGGFHLGEEAVASVIILGSR